jgi:hypothetical protein
LLWIESSGKRPELAARLEGAGLAVIGPAHAVAHGKQLAREEQIDAALLDMNLAGERVDDLAAVLLPARYLLPSSADTVGEPCRLNLREPLLSLNRSGRTRCWAPSVLLSNAVLQPCSLCQS